MGVEERTMKTYSDGEKSTGPCEKCKSIVSTTYRLAPYRHRGDLFQNIMQEVCDKCGATVAIPHQSVADLHRCASPGCSNELDGLDGGIFCPDCIDRNKQRR
jgi:hypothetical protein